MNRFRFLLLIFVFTCVSVASKGQQAIAPNIEDPRLDFVVLKVNGDSLRLSSLKGQVFILDFWASWCRPCRYANKDFLKLYKIYHDKGLEILSISLDDSKKAWKRAIATDKITWLHGNDIRGWDAMGALKWQVEALPSTFLINKNGDVVAVNPELDDLEMKIKELLGL